MRCCSRTHCCGGGWSTRSPVVTAPPAPRATLKPWEKGSILCSRNTPAPGQSSPIFPRHRKAMWVRSVVLRLGTDLALERIRVCIAPFPHCCLWFCARCRAVRFMVLLLSLMLGMVPARAWNPRHNQSGWPGGGSGLRDVYSLGRLCHSGAGRVDYVRAYPGRRIRGAGGAVPAP